MTGARISPLSIAFISLILLAIFAPVTVSMVGQGGDYVRHIEYALLWEQEGFWGKPLPHFLYQSLVIFFRSLFPGNSLGLAAAIVNVFSSIGLGITLYVWIYRTWGGHTPRQRMLAATSLTVVLMLVAPVNLLTWNMQNLYLGYIGINSYHNPTVILLKPLALWLFLFAVRVFQNNRAGLPLVLLCAGVAAFATITKPNYAICILPALAVYTLYSLHRRQPIDWRLLFVGIVIPITEVIIWQYFFYRYQGIGGFSIAPFQVMNLYAQGQILPKLVLSILFPVCVLALYFKQVVQSLLLRLSWLAFAFGAFYMYFFIETRAWQDGNFTWGGEVTLFLLFVSSVIFLIKQFLASRTWTHQTTICVTALILHFISGIAFYIPNLSSAWNSWY